MQSINAIKMVVLSKLLFLLQTIPAEPPNMVFQEIDKSISRLIWQGKKPRIKYKTLQLAKNKGGLSLTTMGNYYRAAVIIPLVDM